jgi:hypothetical protein
MICPRPLTHTRMSLAAGLYNSADLLMSDGVIILECRVKTGVFEFSAISASLSSPFRCKDRNCNTP